jgi:hypothetical protein
MMKRSEHSAWLRNLLAMIALVALFGFGMTAKAARAACTGDCGNTNTVTVTDIITMVNIALGNVAVTGCQAGDANGDGQITVDEILAAVNNALNGCVPITLGCGNGQKDGDEECDLGGTCLGGNKAGSHCTSEADCGLDQNGVCFGGSKAETQCDPTNASACPGGTCQRCVPQGGNGCASNCTLETEVVMNLKPGELAGLDLVPGTSGATVYNGVLGPIALPFQQGTTQTFAVGKERNGQIPAIVLAASVRFPKIDVSGLACACVRGVGAKACGGMSFKADGTAATDCTEGFTAGASVCPADLPCTYVHGNGGSCSNAAKTCLEDTDCPGGTCVKGGNSAAGIISCVSGLQGVDLLYTQDSRGATDPAQCDVNNVCADDNPCVPPDCNCWKPTTGSVPGLCGDPPELILSGTGPAGSASIVNTTSIGQLVGSCSDPTKVPPTFCTDDDPIDIRGTPNTLPLVTGTASAEMFGINGTETSCTGGECVYQGIPDGTPCSQDADCGDTLCNCPPGAASCDRIQCSGPITLPGQPLGSCNQLAGASPNVSGFGLVGAFTSLSNPTTGDIVVTDLLMGE